MRAPTLKNVEGRVLFVNAKPHEALTSNIEAVQWFKPYYEANNTFGVASQRVKQYTRIEEVSDEYDAAYLLFPKNITEGRYLIAHATRLVRNGGMIYISAENKAGGNRLQKIVQQFSGEIVQQISKHKSRFVAFENTDLNENFIAEAIKEGSLKTINDIGFKSQAGVYGYDKIDKGSAVLLQNIPHNLSGKIADFGCGYGFLLQHIVQQNEGIKTVYVIDADARALKCAEENLKDETAEYLWADLTKFEGIPNNLDAIIMNPPFHEGKKTDSDIGIAFIQTAAKSLKKGGMLYMVANNQLPYEGVLKDIFSSYEMLAQENGFKVFKACR